MQGGGGVKFLFFISPPRQFVRLMSICWLDKKKEATTIGDGCGLYEHVRKVWQVSLEKLVTRSSFQCSTR